MTLDLERTDRARPSRLGTPTVQAATVTVLLNWTVLEKRTLSEQESQRECQGCHHFLAAEEVKCLMCGTYREDVQERMVWWWTIKLTQALVLVVLFYFLAAGHWASEASRLDPLVMVRSVLFWSIVGCVLVFEPASLYFGLKIHRDTGVGFYKWLG